MRSKTNTLLVLAAVSMGFFSIGCAKQQAAPPARPPVQVSVASVVVKTVPIELKAIGNVEAYSTVSIKAQINAELMETHFEQGDFVKKGQLLFTLDHRPFDAALSQAQANLVRDQAQAQNAAVQALRYKKLYEEGVAPKEQYDSLQATADAMEAAQLADQAAVENAKLELQYCFIYSPIDGQTGSLLVYPGNLVKQNDVPILITINQVNPIYVDFTLPEIQLAQVRRYPAINRLVVEAYTKDDPGHPETGTLSFIDNAVDMTTGTIKLKGTFANANRRLWPGQFVDVVLRLGEQAGAIVIPSQAIQIGQEGKYVFVVKPDLTVESRSVAIDRALDGDTVLQKGLAAGERVVTDGQLRLVPGAKVEIKTATGSR